MFVSIDIIILVIYTVVEGANGNLNAIIKSNDENFKSLSGVRCIQCSVVLVWFQAI